MVRAALTGLLWILRENTVWRPAAGARREDGQGIIRLRRDFLRTMPSYVSKVIEGIDGLRIGFFSYCLPYLNIL